MNSMGKAIWYIESHLGSEMSLTDVAQAAGLSKFHLVRAFNAYSGQSLMRYVRARRLSEAAKVLMSSSSGIIVIALDAGYNSHEAFTRAFGEQFGMTPDQLRQSRSLEKIQLMEPLKMSDTLNHKMTNLSEPQIIQRDAMLIVGLKKRYNDITSAQMPSQWEAFQPHIGNIDTQKGNNVAYGILCNGDDEGNIDYMTGVEVSQYPDALETLDCLRIASQTYAVFRHEGHVSDISRTWKTIFGKWLPETSRKLVDAPQMERYGEGFDPQSGVGDIEIWIPVRA